MGSAKTYSSRSNARRAGTAAGNPTKLVQVTVHQSSHGVRFGWRVRQVAVAVKAPEQAAKAVLARRRGAGPGEARNGVRRPREGGACRAVWNWLDDHPSTLVKELKVVAVERGWNLNNAVSEFYAWRKFSGTSS
jgi:hypothetical protein